MEMLPREEHERLVKQAYHDGVAEEQARCRSIYRVGVVCSQSRLADHLIRSTGLTIEQSALIIMAATPSPAILPAAAERQAMEVLQ
jgi:hypothetical protein